MNVLALTPRHAADDVATHAIEMAMRQTSRNGWAAAPMLDQMNVCRDFLFVMRLETPPPRVLVVRQLLVFFFYRHRGVIRFKTN